MTIACAGKGNGKGDKKYEMTEVGVAGGGGGGGGGGSKPVRIYRSCVHRLCVCRV